MGEFEVCQIVHMSRSEWSKGVGWWEARQVGRGGEVTIAKSDEYWGRDAERGFLRDFVLGPVLHNDDMQILVERRRAAHAHVVAQLVAQGWEPVGTDKDGVISVMKRTTG